MGLNRLYSAAQAYSYLTIALENHFSNSLVDGSYVPAFHYVAPANAKLDPIPSL